MKLFEAPQRTAKIKIYLLKKLCELTQYVLKNVRTPPVAVSKSMECLLNKQKSMKVIFKKTQIKFLTVDLEK